MGEARPSSLLCESNASEANEAVVNELAQERVPNQSWEGTFANVGEGRMVGFLFRLKDFSEVIDKVEVPHRGAKRNWLVDEDRAELEKGVILFEEVIDQYSPKGEGAKNYMNEEGGSPFIENFGLPTGRDTLLCEDIEERRFTQVCDINIVNGFV